ncbi:CopD family protein [Haloarcula sp. S1AR25-5A]|uniref:CopD family protein n=1 Tax=Haloarcula terrestris TaxID=2950533 RepID=A0AAE4JFP0_9EURY|nr:CopD family protein [Haloarcula terrestris]MDS0220533.1 CopD family protein [Haloarcula terrestris]
MAALPIRTLHVLSMAVLVGGTTVLWYSYRSGAIASLAPAKQFEWLFWGGVGVLVFTGVGNLGALGPPGPGTEWGRTLLVKLIVVVALVVGSGVRTLLLVQASGREATSGDLSPALQRTLSRAYGATAAVLLGIVVLAEVLAHG